MSKQNVEFEVQFQVKDGGKIFRTLLEYDLKHDCVELAYYTRNFLSKAKL